MKNRAHFAAALLLFWGNSKTQQRYALHGHFVLAGQVGVEYFALDDEPEFLPAPLATLTAAQVAADGRALS